VAGEGGLPVEGALLENLLRDLNSRRDRLQSLLVESYLRVPIRITVKVLVDPRYVRATVLANALDAVRQYLHFDNLDLGQAIYASAISTAVQRVQGVVAVDVAKLRRKQSDGPASPPGQVLLRPNELAALAEPGDLTVLAGMEAT
jgi:hypothetical protein